MQDKTLRCRECGQDFVFTAGEQEFYAQRGLANAPSRCPSCRAAARASRGGGGGGRMGGGGSRSMYDAVCAQCGKECQVPFQPREDRPVYCSDCYAAQRGESGRGDRRPGGGGGRRDRY